MTLIRLYSMMCDKCLDYHEGGQDCYANRVRKSAKEAGWKKIRGKDYCPKCQKDMEEFK